MKKKKITLREFIKAHNIIESDIDVYVDGIDGIAVVFPLELTEVGEEYFKDALDMCWVENGGSCIEWESDDTDDEDGIPNCAWLAWQLLKAQAGYCSVENFDKWFKDVVYE